MQVNPNIRKDKWTPEEDDQLRALVKEYGSSWAEISRNIEVGAKLNLRQCWWVCRACGDVRRHMQAGLLAISR